MDNIVVSTAESVVLSTNELNNTVSIIKPDNTLTTNTDGTVVTIPSESVVLVQVPNDTIVITGLVGPAGPAGTSEEDQMYAKRVDFITDNELYRGEAAVGSSESNAVWRIRKLVIGTDGDVTETWAGGTAAFDKVWADRLTLIYS